jgi:hypothetical protein
VLQIAFSVLLLTVAGLAYRSSTLMLVDIGFDPEPILIVAVGTPATSRAENGAVLDSVRERLANIPNVAAVSYTAESLGFWNRTTVASLDSAQPIPANHSVVGAGYLDVFDVDLVAGRALTAEDRARPTPAAVVNQQLASALWHGRSPLGQTLLIGQGREQVEIVGVMPDAFYGGFNPDRPDKTPNYVLLAKWPDSIRDPAGSVRMPTSFLVRHRGDVAPVSVAVPAALSNTAPGVALASRERLGA